MHEVFKDVVPHFFLFTFAGFSDGMEWGVECMENFLLLVFARGREMTVTNG
jgi:hypothetical protein